MSFVRIVNTTLDVLVFKCLFRCRDLPFLLESYLSFIALISDHWFICGVLRLFGVIFIHVYQYYQSINQSIPNAAWSPSDRHACNYFISLASFLGQHFLTMERQDRKVIAHKQTNIRVQKLCIKEVPMAIKAPL